jgi:hypothetical protein
MSDEMVRMELDERWIVVARCSIDGTLELRVRDQNARPDIGTLMNAPRVCVTGPGRATVRGRWRPFRVLGITLARARSIEEYAREGIEAIERDREQRSAMLGEVLS